MPPMLIEEVSDVTPGSLPEITLNQVEAKVRQILLDVVDFIENTPASNDLFQSQVDLPPALQNEKLTLRFTGGWVRDKLLGIPSHDIDVAINKMTGEQFGLRLLEYMQIEGNAQKYDLEGVAGDDKQDQKAGMTPQSKLIGGLHKIEANPAKSKHLETTATRILGLDIDLVNLRKETYTDDSRNPQIEFGTPEEDALRRDATANAMFYNLHTGKVEDFTRKGYVDLCNKTLRTPLEPYDTFKDDPLRVLRLIRFASRLDWTIEPSALEAMQHQDIKEALHRKISRERVGIELEKALRGPNPHEALRLISEVGLYKTTYCDPAAEAAAEAAAIQPDLDDWPSVLDTLQEVLDSADAIANIAARDPEEQFVAWQLASIVPYRNAPVPQAEPGRKAGTPFSTHVMREGIKASNKICDVVTASVRHVSEISAMVESFSRQNILKQKAVPNDQLRRDVIGMKLRAWGPTWRSQIIYAFLVDVADSVQNAEACRTRYNKFLDHLKQLDLLDVCELRPLIDGKFLAKALDTKPGPWMKDALDVVMAWQLRNPGKTDTSEAVEEVKMHGELAISLAKHFLELTIRPLFSKTKRSDITEQARKDDSKRLPPRVNADDERVTKPWKQSNERHVLKLLRWSIQALTKHNIEQLWSLCIPPILTLIDDWEVQYKMLGINLLGILLEVTPEDLLKRTGIGPVLEQALLPCLTFLPPLSSEKESLELLPAVYSTMVILAGTQHPKLKLSADESAWKTMPSGRVKALDNVLRKGIFYEYSHVSERPALASLLFDELRVLVKELGIDAVKHLKYIIPMLNETLCNRLSRFHIGLLRSAVQSMGAVLDVCQPRVSVHRAEFLQGLTLCWLNVDAETSEDAGLLRAELKAQAAAIVTIVKQHDVSWEAERATLIAADHRLTGLFT